jgi:hypothetical protein
MQKRGVGGLDGQCGPGVADADMVAALLPVRERVLGLEHPGTLTARANLVYWTRMADRA